MFTSIELIIDQYLKRDRHKLELQMPETMKVFGDTKKLKDKTKKELKVSCSS